MNCYIQGQQWRCKYSTNSCLRLVPQIREGMLRKRKDVDNGSPSVSAWAGHVYNLGASTLCPPLSLTPPRWSQCQFSAKHVPLGFIKKYLEWIRIWNLWNTNWCNVLFNCYHRLQVTPFTKKKHNFQIFPTPKLLCL